MAYQYDILLCLFFKPWHRMIFLFVCFCDGRLAGRASELEQLAAEPEVCWIPYWERSQPVWPAPLCTALEPQAAPLWSPPQKERMVNWEKRMHRNPLRMAALSQNWLEGTQLLFLALAKTCIASDVLQNCWDLPLWSIDDGTTRLKLRGQITSQNW